MKSYHSDDESVELNKHLSRNCRKGDELILFFNINHYLYFPSVFFKICFRRNKQKDFYFHYLLAPEIREYYRTGFCQKLN